MKLEIKDLKKDKRIYVKINSELLHKLENEGHKLQIILDDALAKIFELKIDAKK